MSHAGHYLKTASGLFNALQEGKPHSSITDWIEVLSSDRYEELSLDGIPELVESVNILSSNGTIEAARAIRKKLKYGNVHRQLRALVILRALTENASKGFKLNWADEMIMSRLKDMANDSLLDPKVKKRLILVFHAWSIQYKDEPRMREVAGLYAKYGHVSGAGPGIRKATTAAPGPTSANPFPSGTRSRGGFNDDDLYSHDWAPSKRGPDTYADLAAAKADAEERKAQRDRQIALEQREAEIERREREHKRKQDMAALEARRQKEAEEEAERRRKAKLEMKGRGSGTGTPTEPKRPKFDLAKERPQIMVSVANAIQAANTLVNACRHINREYENLLESPKVQDALDKAKATRRVVIKYLQLVQEETLVGTLLDANEKVVEAIQLYDKLCKPAALDSDDERDPNPPPAAPEPKGPSEMEMLTKRMQAQKLEADRKTELQKLQERQKKESKKRVEQGRSYSNRGYNTHPDLADLDFGGSIGNSGGRGERLPPPLSPDSERGDYGGGLSDFSDYDSSDSEYRAAQSRSRRQSTQPSRKSSEYDRRYDQPQSSRGGGGTHSRKQSGSDYYRSLDDDGNMGSKRSAREVRAYDPFADENDTPVQEKPRMQWTEI